MDEIFEHFSKTIDDYDTVADKVVMKNDELHESVVNSLPFNSGMKLNIVDLGSGTGHGMRLILNKFPQAKVTGIDFSLRMISKSQTNLIEFRDQFKLINKDFNKVDFENDYDAIVSAVTIHNSAHEQKKELFKKIYGSLKKGGVFVNGDFIEGETEEISKKYQELYRDYLKSNLIGHELEVWLRHAFVEDKPMKLSEQFRILHTAGFKEVKLVWQFNNMAVYIAVK